MRHGSSRKWRAHHSSHELSWRGSIGRGGYSTAVRRAPWTGGRKPRVQTGHRREQRLRFPTTRIFRRGLQEDGCKDREIKGGIPQGEEQWEPSTSIWQSRMNEQADRNAHWDMIWGCWRLDLGIRVCGQADKTRRITRQSTVHFLKSQRANACSFLLFKSFL